MSREGDGICSLLQGFGLEHPYRAAEIGVWEGRTSAHLLSAYPGLLLWMIDLWDPACFAETYRRSGDSKAGSSVARMREAREAALRATEFAPVRRVVIQGDAMLVAEHVRDASFDFVFLDADHSYEGTRIAIEAWGPKIMAGGVLCGHDYNPGTYPGVVQAVDELGAHTLAFRGRGDVEHTAGYVWGVRR